MSKSQKTLRALTESAIMLALATALSLVKIVELPYGGSVTVASMLPVLIIAYRYGVKWGLLTGAAYGGVQQLLGLKNLSYVTTWQSVLAVILLDYVVAFLCCTAQKDVALGHATDDGDVDGVVVAVGMGVSAHDGDAEPPDPFLHAPEEHAADAVVGHGDHIDHGGGTASHGRDVVHVHEDREVTRHVGVGLDQGFHDAVGGEEDVAVPHLDGCRILSLGRCHAGEGVGGQEVHHLVDLALPGDSREVPDRIDYGLEFHIHHSASMGCTTTRHHPSML